MRKPLQELAWRINRNPMVSGEGDRIGGVAKIGGAVRKEGAVSIEDAARIGDAASTGGAPGTGELSGRWRWINAFREP